jgi:hypothetical protein
MANVVDYVFDNMSRLGNDVAENTQRNQLNVKHANYHLKNHNNLDCAMTNPIEFATKQPNVFFKGSNQIGPNGCNIDDHSKLTILSTQTTPKCRISLYPRPYLTVPYLGKGIFNLDAETNLQQGENNRVKKSVLAASEICYMDQKTYPMMNSIQDTVTNPNNLIENDAADGWIRGGLPSRDAMRNHNYYNLNCNK